MVADSHDNANSAISQESGGKAIKPRTLPIKHPYKDAGDGASEAATQDIGQIVGPDKYARPANQQCQKSEQNARLGKRQRANAATIAIDAVA